MLCHFFADGTFRWLRERFVALPAWAQGALLAAAALVLRELGHTKLVKFIYFQFLAGSSLLEHVGALRGEPARERRR